MLISAQSTDLTEPDARSGNQPLHTRLEAVHVSYDDLDECALQNVSFDIPAGQVTALAGLPGAGRSTCTAVLTGRRLPDAGRVIVGGEDLQSQPVAKRRGLVADVTQDDDGQSESIAEAICPREHDLSRSEIERAARQALIHDAIARMPQGYDTPWSDWTRRLLAAERQRIAVARASLLDVPLLILQESSADAESGWVLDAALAHARRGRSVLVLARHLSTMQAADMIVVLERGYVVEQGNHDELAGWGDRYARLIAPLRAAG